MDHAKRARAVFCPVRSGTPGRLGTEDTGRARGEGATSAGGAGLAAARSGAAGAARPRHELQPGFSTVAPRSSHLRSSESSWRLGRPQPRRQRLWERGGRHQADGRPPGGACTGRRGAARLQRTLVTKVSMRISFRVLSFTRNLQ